MKHTLAISYQFGMENTQFQEFADSLATKTLKVNLEQDDNRGPYASTLWTMMTLAAVFIGSNYFGGILKEIGKDHYLLLKESLAKLTKKTIALPRVEPTMSGSKKRNNDNPFSMAFSVFAELPNKSLVKLLIPKVGGTLDYSVITNAFLEFVLRCYEEGDSVLDEIGCDVYCRMSPITVAYDVGTGKIYFADSDPEHVRQWRRQHPPPFSDPF